MFRGKNDYFFSFTSLTLGSVDRERVNAMKKMKSIERHRYENSHYADDDDNIVFEDFARMRMNEPE